MTVIDGVFWYLIVMSSICAIKGVKHMISGVKLNCSTIRLQSLLMYVAILPHIFLALVLVSEVGHTSLYGLSAFALVSTGTGIAAFLYGHKLKSAGMRCLGMASVALCAICLLFVVTGLRSPTPGAMYRTILEFDNGIYLKETAEGNYLYARPYDLDGYNVRSISRDEAVVVIDPTQEPHYEYARGTYTFYIPTEEDIEYVTDISGSLTER